MIAVLSPVYMMAQRELVDSFPLSFYPMFRGLRPDRARINYVTGYDRDGVEIPIPLEYVTSGSMNLGRRQINRAVAKGAKAQTDLCRRTAVRLRKSSSPTMRRIFEVRVVSAEFYASRYLRGDRTPMSSRVLASCRVRGGRP
ncbi:MAG: hypothetical protein M5R36_02005 [Deltaproteobacteria bacterium]|nr:hypothetical protein [Deltaproteobacteria bacterium]